MRAWIVLTVQLALSIPHPFGGDHPYHWKKAIESGTGREESDWKEGSWPRIYVEPLVSGDTLLMIGSDRTWRSVDGIRWKASPHNGRWGKRYGASYTLFKGRMWIMGGMKTWDDFANDVWASENGTEWTLVTASAPWTKRRGHATLVHEGKMWLVGGAESSGASDMLPKKSLGEVWVTADGMTWEKVTDRGPWQAEFSKEFFSTNTPAHQFAGKIWVMGGPLRNSVWSSADGRHWMMEAEHAPWPGRYAGGTAVFDNRLWIFGGAGHHDVWFSINGKAWEQLTAQAPWSPRAPGPVVAFHDRLWMFGGKTGKSNDPGDDVWYLEPNRTHRQKEGPLKKTTN